MPTRDAEGTRVPRPNYAVIGFVSSSFGLAVACHGTIRALLASRRPLRLVDVDPRWTGRGIDETFATVGDTTVPGRPTVNVFHLNPQAIETYERDWLHATDAARGIRVCVPFWEMPHLPKRWVPLLDTMDAVLAPTAFVEQACREALTCPVLSYPQAVFLPEDVRADRQRWGIDPDAVVFLAAFDPSSDVERKNPYGALRAFVTAFGDRDDVRFVIHPHVKADDPRQVERIEALRREIGAYRNVTMLAEKLAYRDVLSLYASSDVFVSLHRAEGLGLPLMEAMSLGKVVVATGWSGNTDYMDETNSCLVTGTPIRLEAQHGAYKTEFLRPEQYWVDPDLDEAAEVMRRLAADPALRARLGAKAAEDMRARRESFLAGAAFDELEALLAHGRTGADERDRGFRRILRRARFRRGVGDALRRTGLI